MLWKIVLLFKSVADIPLQMLVTHQYLNPPFSSALYFFINFTLHGIFIVFFPITNGYTFTQYLHNHLLKVSADFGTVNLKKKA